MTKKSPNIEPSRRPDGMKRFSSKMLNKALSFGDRLRQERQAHGLDLRQVSFKLKIPEKYLAALENEELVQLPGGSYGKHFLIQYANFLKLPTQKLRAEYDIRADYAGSSKHTALRRAKPTFVWPIKRIVLIGLSIILVGYIALEARRLFLPPPFTVLNPPANIEIQDLTIVTRGQTVPGAEVLLNGAAVPVAENGNFSQEVTLQPGLNTLTFSARRAYSQPVTIRREVLVTTLAESNNFWYS
mgnify:CR=1 FL=1